MGLITLAEAKSHLGVTASTYDTAITAMIAEAGGAMEKECGRHLESYQRTEIISGTGHELLWLAEQAESVVSINVDSDQSWADSNLVAAADYIAEGCTIERLDAVWTKAQRNTRVIYNAGFATVPDHLKRLCKRQVAHMYSWWQAEKQGLDIVESHTVEGWRQAFRDQIGLAPEVRAGLKRYVPERL